MMTLVKKLSMLFGVFLLASCSVFSPVKSASQNNYVLSQIPSSHAAYKSHHITLMVAQPEMSQAYNTTDMAYATKPYQIAYFSQNRWAETPGQMLYPLVVQTLQNTHFFHAVVTAPYTGNYDYVLNTQVLQLLQDFTCRPARVQLTVRVQLTKVATNTIVAAKQFTVYEPFRQRTPYAGVFAANNATVKMLEKMTRFTLYNIN